MSRKAQAVSSAELPEPARMPESPGARFAARANVLAARTRDTVVLLDRATDRYVTLNDVAAEIWNRLSEGMTPESIVEVFCSHYDVQREQVRADVYAQVAEFVLTGLIEPMAVNQTPVPAEVSAAHRLSIIGHPSRAEAPHPATPSGEFRPSSCLRCTVVIAVIKLRLAIQGFGRTVRWIRRQVDGMPMTEHADLKAVRAEEYGLAMAAALYPGRTQCLERSLALYLLLRRRGVAVRYRQGVQPFPFKAHAWLEYRGEVINDVPEHAKQFTPLPESLL